MSPEGITMSDIEGKPCRFCGKPINAAEGYTVVPGESEDHGAYHHTETLHCYDKKIREEKPESRPSQPKTLH